MNPRVEKFKCVGKSTLEMLFKNGETKLFDLEPYFRFPVYEALRDEAFFKKARAVHGTVVWNDVIDFDPDTLNLEGSAV